jgi:hypothetical protein
VSLIDDGFESTELPERSKVALRFADRFLMDPGAPSEAESQELAAEFDAAELTELALGLGLFHGFSKMLIAMGMEPDAMDTTVLETPTAETTTPAVDTDEAHVRLLSAHPDLAARWALAHTALQEFDGLDPATLDRCRARVAQLHGVEWASESAYESSSGDFDAALAITELFVIDVRAITPEQLSAVRDQAGADGLMQLLIGLALWDGIYRVALTTASAGIAPALP